MALRHETVDRSGERQLVALSVHVANSFERGAAHFQSVPRFDEPSFRDGLDRTQTLGPLDFAFQALHLRPQRRVGVLLRDGG